MDPQITDRLDEIGAPVTTRVLVLWENGSATYFLKPGEQVTLGRHSECEVMITLPTVSRRHARLTGATLGTGSHELAHVEDIGGMNGVRVRGQLIPLNKPMPAGAGDVIELGGAIVVLHPPRDRRGAPSVGAMARASAMRPMSGEDPMKAVDRLIDVVAQSDLSVLLLGETGVGKSFAAESIHSRSARARGPLSKLNCSALSEALLEGELFGYERGAFTGATQTKDGLLEAADGGTILLDEIGEMSLTTQAKLLNVIETREVTRLGSVQPRKLDVRFISATNRDLLARCAEGLFRLDLFYRLNGISIVIPPLRERAGEILRFATRFLNEAAKRAGKAAPRLSNEAIGMVVRHPFYGNIREMKNAMERACVLAPSGFIGPEHLMFEPAPAGARVTTGSTSVSTPIIPIAAAAPGVRSSFGRFGAIAPTEPPDAVCDSDPVLIPMTPRMPVLEGLDPRKMVTEPAPAPPSPPPSPSPLPVAALKDQMTAFERDRIVAALDQCHGNQTRAAEMLGMSRRALIARIEQYGLPRPRKR